MSGHRSKRHRNHGLRKRCTCDRRRWAGCPDPWFFAFRYKKRTYEFNINNEVNRAILSKSEAEALRDRFRAEIRAGTFRNGLSGVSTSAADLHTFNDVAAEYLKRYVWQPGRRTRSGNGMRWYVEAIQRAEIPASNGRTVAFGSKPLDAITKADVEALRAMWVSRRPGSKNGIVGPNRMLSRLKHFFRWAIAEGYTDRTPFTRNMVNVIKLDSRVEQPRTRRLQLDEEQRLLAAAGDHLRALIIAALETGCRLGELLSLQWKDVHADQHVILLQASKTKTFEARDVPVTQRLAAVLEMRKHAPDGKKFGSEAFVFDNAFGEQAKSIREAWTNTLRRAKITDLHFHDLRREFGSRLLESGASAHIVRDWLGHADISTTSRYLATTRVSLQRAARQFEEHLRPGSQAAETPVGVAGVDSGRPAGWMRQQGRAE